MCEFPEEAQTSRKQKCVTAAVYTSYIMLSPNMHDKVVNVGCMVDVSYFTLVVSFKFIEVIDTKTDEFHELLESSSLSLVFESHPGRWTTLSEQGATCNQKSGSGEPLLILYRTN